MWLHLCMVVCCVSATIAEARDPAFTRAPASAGHMVLELTAVPQTVFAWTPADGGTEALGIWALQGDTLLFASEEAGGPVCFGSVRTDLRAAGQVAVDLVHGRLFVPETADDGRGVVVCDLGPVARDFTAVHSRVAISRAEIEGRLPSAVALSDGGDLYLGFADVAEIWCWRGAREACGREPASFLRWSGPGGVTAVALAGDDLVVAAADGLWRVKGASTRGREDAAVERVALPPALATARISGLTSDPAADVYFVAGGSVWRWPVGTSDFVLHARGGIARHGRYSPFAEAAPRDITPLATDGAGAVWMIAACVGGDDTPALWLIPPPSVGAAERKR